MKREIFDDEHRWFREGAAAFVDRTIVPAREAIREDRLIGRDIWLAAGEAGLLGLGIAAEHGGSGTDDFRFNAVLAEELARAGMAFASSFGIHTDVVSPYLTELTTPDQQERWLPKFCTGEIITAIGMTEPGAGSDLAALRTTAERHDDGWLLNGSKTFITNGYQADLIVVAARTTPGSGSKGISLLVVEAGMDGFSRGRKLHKVGQHEADTAELFFEDVLVPEDNVIGVIDNGFRHMMERLSQERLSAAVANLAHARAAVADTLEYVKERRAFGRPIGSFQHNRFTLATLVTELEVTQAYVDRCVSAHVDHDLDAVDAAKAKFWTAEVQNKAIDACVQLLGGYGYMEEYDVARAWTDARVTKIWAGSNEIMLEIIGRSLDLGDPRPERPAVGAAEAR